MLRTSLEGIAAWHAELLLDLVPAAVDLAAEVDPDWMLVQALARPCRGAPRAPTGSAPRSRTLPPVFGSRHQFDTRSGSEPLPA
jgi:hypothetical protein